VIEEEPLNPARGDVLNIGAIPEFVRINDLYDFYKALTDANTNNKATTGAED
jgi:hypothetical protein